MDTAKYIWMDGRQVPWDEANVHVLSHGLHYGTGVFEGIRAYEAAGGTAVFRLREHMERLMRSCKAYHMDAGYSVDELVDATKDLLRANELESGYIRPIIFLGLGALGLNPGERQSADRDHHLAMGGLPGRGGRSRWDSSACLVMATVFS